MRTIYLNISDFYIKISFLKPKFTLFLRDKLQREIMTLFRDFVTLHKPQTIHYEIEFKESNTIGYIGRKNAKVKYISLFEQVSKSKIRTYYSISTSQFHFILKEVITELLMHKGFFQHASGIIHNDKVILFVGKSGAGKSTISSFLNESYTPFNDDLVLVQEQENRYMCFQTPLWERNWWYRKHNQKYPLGAIFFLVKASQCSIKPIKSKQQVLNLILSDLSYDREHINKKMYIFLKFISTFNNFYYLYFPKNKDEVKKYFKEKVENVYL